MFTQSQPFKFDKRGLGEFALLVRVDTRFLTLCNFFCEDTKLTSLSKDKWSTRSGTS